MAQRDHEEQPEAPDLCASSQLETSESQVGPPGEQPLDAGYVPPDRPYGLHDEVTPASMQQTEPLDDRLDREQPDVGGGEQPEPGGSPSSPATNAAADSPLQRTPRYREPVPMTPPAAPTRSTSGSAVARRRPAHPVIAR